MVIHQLSIKTINRAKIAVGRAVKDEGLGCKGTGTRYIFNPLDECFINEDITKPLALIPSFFIIRHFTCSPPEIIFGT